GSASAPQFCRAPVSEYRQSGRTPSPVDCRNRNSCGTAQSQPDSREPLLSPALEPQGPLLHRRRWPEFHVSSEPTYEPQFPYRIASFPSMLSLSLGRQQNRDRQGAALNHFDAHTAAGPLHLLHRRFDGEAIQIGHLDLGDLFHLLRGDLSDFVLIRLSRTF